MAFFDKFKKKESDLPSSLRKYEKTTEVQIVKAKTRLSSLEDQTKAKIRAEINNVKYHRDHKKNDPRAVVRLKNTYYCLLLIREAQERMADIEASYELDVILNGLSQAIKTVNGLEGKTDTVNTWLLRYRERKLKGNALAAKEGDMREFFSQSIDELISDEVVEELLSRKKPLSDIVNDDTTAIYDDADFFLNGGLDTDGLNPEDILNMDLSE